MLLRDLKPKYDTLEIMFFDHDRFQIFGIRKYDEVERFYDREVLSVKDYDDTKSTSVILGKKVI